MSTPAKSAIISHRARRSRAGFVRVEVSVLREDVGLVRQVAAALTDAERQADARRRLHRDLATAPSADLKALLASAPLDGIDLTRQPDAAREIEL